VVICLERRADLHMAQLMPLPLVSLASAKSRLVLLFWYRLTMGSPGQRAVKRLCNTDHITFTKVSVKLCTCRRATVYDNYSGKSAICHEDGRILIAIDRYDWHVPQFVVLCPLVPMENVIFFAHPLENPVGSPKSKIHIY